MTHVPLYRQALAHSWQLAWRNKFLWIFGLFATLLGQMGLLEIFTHVTLASNDYALYPRWLAVPKLLEAGSEMGPLVMPAQGWVWFLFIIVLLLGLGLSAVFAAVVSQGALIDVTAQSLKKKTLSLSHAWHTGVTHFWRLFTIQIIKKITFVFLSVAVGYATLNVVVAETTTWGDIALFFLVFLLVLLVGFSLSFLVVYAAGYIVTEEYPFVQAVEAAWKLFVSHWLVSIEVGLIILVLNVIMALAGMLGLLVAFLPTVLLWFVAVLTANSALYVAALFVGVLLGSVWVIFVGSVFTVFTTATWTYLFMKMHSHGVTSRISHFWHAPKQ